MSETSLLKFEHTGRFCAQSRQARPNHVVPHSRNVTNGNTIYLNNAITVEFSSENLKGRDHSEDLDLDGRITLEWILEK
jgi:hypothetical protein